MAKNADLLICDSVNIENYMKKTYMKYKPNTTFIAYGSNVQTEEHNEKEDQQDSNEKLNKWYEKNKLQENEYYLIVGRFVPENNYETMIKEFMKTSTHKDLVIITNVEKNKFYSKLQQETNFEKDKRIKFVGTVYDATMLKNIRKNAYAYIHGHEAGGTNPSLLEALSTTKLNLLLDVGFNKEVAKDGAIYWSKKEGSLSSLIKDVEKLPAKEIDEYSTKAKRRIEEDYTWQKVVKQYEELFMKEN